MDTSKGVKELRVDKALLCVFTAAPDLPVYEVERIAADWKRMRQVMPYIPPLVIVPHGCTLTAVLDPREPQAEEPVYVNK